MISNTGVTAWNGTFIVAASPAPTDTTLSVPNTNAGSYTSGGVMGTNTLAVSSLTQGSATISGTSWVPINTGSCVTLGNSQSISNGRSAFQVHTASAAAGSPALIELTGNDTYTAGDPFPGNGNLMAACPDNTSITFAQGMSGSNIRHWEDNTAHNGVSWTVTNVSAGWGGSSPAGYTAQTNMTWNYDGQGGPVGNNASLVLNTFAHHVGGCFFRTHAVLNVGCDDVGTDSVWVASVDTAYSAGTVSQLSFPTGSATGHILSDTSRQWLVTAITGCPSGGKSSSAVSSVQLDASGGHDLVNLASPFTVTGTCPIGTQVQVFNGQHTDFDFQNVTGGYTMSVIDTAECGSGIVDGNASTCGVTSSLFTQNSVMTDYVRQNITMSGYPSAFAEIIYLETNFYNAIWNNITITNAATTFRGDVAFTLTDGWFSNLSLASLALAGTSPLNNVTFNAVNFGSLIGWASGGMSAGGLSNPDSTNGSSVVVTQSTCPAGYLFAPAELRDFLACKSSTRQRGIAEKRLSRKEPNMTIVLPPLTWLRTSEGRLKNDIRFIGLPVLVFLSLPASADVIFQPVPLQVGQSTVAACAQVAGLPNPTPAAPIATGTTLWNCMVMPPTWTGTISPAPAGNPAQPPFASPYAIVQPAPGSNAFTLVAAVPITALPLPPPGFLEASP